MAGKSHRPTAGQRTPLTAEQKRVMRRRKAQLRTLGRLLLVVLAVAAMVLVWQNWDALAPNNLLGGVETLLGVGTGEYPVNLSGTDALSLVGTQSYSVLLTESHLVYYNHNGAEVTRYPCAYATPVVRAAGQYVLVAEQGGKRLILSTRSKMVLETETKRDIVDVSINNKGQCAVLTRGPDGNRMLVTVYDRKGKELRTYKTNDTLIGVALSPDGSQAATLTTEVKKGTLNTYVDVFSLKGSGGERLCRYEQKDGIFYRMAYLKSGRLAAFNQDGVVLLNPSTGESVVYSPDDNQAIGYCVSGDTLALVVQPYGSASGGQVHLVDKKGELLNQVDFTGNYRHLSGKDGAFVLMTDHYVQKITRSQIGGQAPLTADGQQVLLDGQYAVVLGTNRLDRISLTVE